MSVFRHQWRIERYRRRPVFFASAVASEIAGDAAITLGALTTSAAGTVAVAGAAAITLGALTTTAEGVVGAAPISGDAAITLADVTTTAAGTVAIDGAAAITLGALTTTAAGTVAVDGAAAITLGALTTSATGVVAAGTVEGAAAITLGDLTLVAYDTEPATPAAEATGGWLRKATDKRGAYDFLNPEHWQVRDAQDEQEAASAERTITKRVKTLAKRADELGEGLLKAREKVDAYKRVPKAARQTLGEIEAKLAQVRKWIDDYNRIAAQYQAAQAIRAAMEDEEDALMLLLAA